MLRPAAHRPKEPALAFPRLRYMGSKYRLLPALRAVFATLGFDSALDPFSGSAVVAHALKGMGKRVTASDYLEFAATVARATVENDRVRLGEAAVERLCGPPLDDRDFILRTFRGRFFPDEDLRFLDAAWSHLDRMAGHERDLAIAALCLAAARKQPRGVFTVTGLRYDDGRRGLRLPLRDHFREAAAAYNAAVLDTGRPCRAARADVFDTDPAGHDLVYLDPPYAPPRDDNCYIKRYHFLEGLSVYWRGVEIMEGTATRKLAKRPTRFSSKRTTHAALAELFDRFRGSTIVLSYGSNSLPPAAELHAMLARVKRRVEVHQLDHRYSFGTHAQARRRLASEYLFVAR
ncbi:MAG TPA: DNA adenine methylase [Actinomycetes bacterium]|nr:DNA adenine methylase [Actinomycetes bacterium]